MKTTTRMLPDRMYCVVGIINDAYATSIFDNGNCKLAFVHREHFEGFTQCLNVLGFELITKEQLGYE